MTKQAVDHLIDMAATQVGAPITYGVPDDPMAPRMVFVTNEDGDERAIQVPANATLRQVLEMIVVARKGGE